MREGFRPEWIGEVDRAIEREDRFWGGLDSKALYRW